MPDAAGLWWWGLRTVLDGLSCSPYRKGVCGRLSAVVHLGCPEGARVKPEIFFYYFIQQSVKSRARTLN